MSDGKNKGWPQGIDQLKEMSILGLVDHGIIGRSYQEHGPCPYRDRCSLYKTIKGFTALTEDAKKWMCDYDGGGSSLAPRVGWIHDTHEGTVCDAYLGRKALEAIKILAEKALNATGKDKHDIGGL